MSIDVAWGSVGAGGLVALFIILFFTGRVVARATMDRIVKTTVDAYEGRLRDKDERIAILEVANSQLIQVNQTLLAQNRQSLQIGLATGSVIQSLQGVVAPAGGGQDVAEVA